jgi:hypothetical protein
MKQPAQILTDICREMVEHPEDVRIADNHTKKTAYLKIHAHNNDVTKLIGKSGKNAKALQAIAQRIADTRQMAVKVMVDTEGYVDSPDKHKRFEANATYDPHYHAELLETTAQAIVDDGASVTIAKLDKSAWVLTLCCEPDDELIKDLATLWGAMGKNHGATVIVEGQ